MAKTIKPRGNKVPALDPSDVKKQARSRNLARSAAEITRQHMIPAEILVEWNNAVMQGHSSATCQEDDDGDWYVTWEEGELASTLEQKFHAQSMLWQRGYGMPAQTVHVEQEMRVTVDSSAINVGQLPAAAIAAIAMMRRALLPAGPAPAPEDALPASTIDANEDRNANAIDAEYTESTSAGDVPDPLATENETIEE